MKKSVAPATPIATTSIAKDFPALPQSFFCRPAEEVGPELIGCRLVKRQDDSRTVKENHPHCRKTSQSQQLLDNVVPLNAGFSGMDC